METACKTTIGEQDLEIQQQNKKHHQRQHDLQIGQLVFVKDHHKGTFDPTYIFGHSVSGILNDSTVMLTTLDRKEKKCNICHIKPVIPIDVFTNAFDRFQDSIKRNPCDSVQHEYNLRSKVKLT